MLEQPLESAVLRGGPDVDDRVAGAAPDGCDHLAGGGVSEAAVREGPRLAEHMVGREQLLPGESFRD